MNELSRQITTALNQGIQGMDVTTAARLTAMRRQAVAHLPNHPHQGHGALAWTHAHPWRAVLVAALLAASAWTVYPHLHQDGSEVDIQLLTDELPPQAYAEKDFSAWLK